MVSVLTVVGGLPTDSLPFIVGGHGKEFYSVYKTIKTH